MTSFANVFFQGFALQASLILALGAQNLFVLESGLKKRHHLLVASVSTLCDLLLLLIGVAGAASLFITMPTIKIAFGVMGVLFLFYYGGTKLIAAFRADANEIHTSDEALTRKQILMMTLGFSLLNPHVYLDTIVLVGGYSSKFESLVNRVGFGIGAGAFSMLWFFGVTVFAAVFSRLLNRPRMMRVISLASGLILLTLAVKLGGDVYLWMVELD